MSTTSQEVPPQAGPIPSKRGEIGFEEGVHEPVQRTDGPSSSVVALPERHPADRGAPPPADSTTSGTSTPSAPRAASPATSSVHSTSKSSFAFFKPKRDPLVYGIHSTTLATFFLQLAVIGGSVAGWVLAIRHLSTDPNATSSMNMSSGSSSVFVFVVFAVLVIVQLIFLERTIFRLRAERYGFVHPGEILPRHRNSPTSPRMGLVPWSRPTLPTYAAALAQSGVGTGDVEDNIIAVPPPPAYGNTRGNTLLVSNLFGTRRQSARSSVVSERGQALEVDASVERPKSYVSYDAEWEERRDATIAVVLEENLARMEEGDVTDARTESS